jgi:hypothetical protein
LRSALGAGIALFQYFAHCHLPENRERQLASLDRTRRVMHQPVAETKLGGRGRPIGGLGGPPRRVASRVAPKPIFPPSRWFPVKSSTFGPITATNGGEEGAAGGWT